jgi:hypothetical protein
MLDKLQLEFEKAYREMILSSERPTISSLKSRLNPLDETPLDVWQAFDRYIAESRITNVVGTIKDIKVH